MGVKHRHIIYVQGYDPRGLSQYYRMFRTELRKFGRLYDLDTQVGRPAGPADGERASWQIETTAEDWQTRTTYDFLRWEDLIKDDLAWPVWRTLVHSIAIYWRLVFSGTIGRFWSAHWRFATFITYPHLVVLTFALIAGAAGYAMCTGLTALGSPGVLSIIGGIASAIALFDVLIRVTENRTYALYLLSDTIFTWEFSHRQRPEWDARIDRFAHHLVETMTTTDADEVILVGHSSGSFLGVEILAKALELDPDLGRHGPKLVFVTLGGNMPIVGFHKSSAPFRQHLCRLAHEPSLEWYDCQSRKDVMNFYPFHPVKGHGIHLDNANDRIRIIPVRFRDIVASNRYNKFRWQFFSVHFQFVMANDHPHPYDFFMIVCGPVYLSSRFDMPQSALEFVTGTPEARRIALKKLNCEAISTPSTDSHGNQPSDEAVAP